MIPYAPSPPSAPAPPGHNRFTVATAIFLRLLAIIHLIAFVSAWTQLDGLIGEHGILPARRYFAAAHESLGAGAYGVLPSLCWIFGAGRFLPVLCATGTTLSVLLFTGFVPAVCLILLWACYLSLSVAGQIFWSFQWDALLLEATLAAVFIAPWRFRSRSLAFEPPRFARWLLWWLTFRLMFLAGVVKLSSGDPTWRNLTALTFHFETQPLPTPLAWYAHQLPDWWHRAECAGMFVIELLVPFFLFAPRALRHNAALLLAGFMGVIALTGNYTFFNLLAIALCFFCLDDAWWRPVLSIGRRLLRFRRQDSHAENNSDRLPGATANATISPSRFQCRAALVFALFAFALTGVEVLGVLFPEIGAPPGYQLAATITSPLRSFNVYGLFAVMTHPRCELIFEGSNDGRTWLAYEFPHKPGDPSRRPTWVAPHQPRLDWQLWFAALGSADNNPWVLAQCEHLLRGTPPIMRLLARNPFPDRPPRYIRVVRYEYHFTDAEARRRSGQWWRRTPLDIYVPAASLK
jgi:lipase maturation factor 1